MSPEPRATSHAAAPPAPQVRPRMPLSGRGDQVPRAGAADPAAPALTGDGAFKRSRAHLPSGTVAGERELMRRS